MAELAEAVLGLTDLKKAGGARTSDWRKWPLSPQQATYAARDVCVCVDIFWKGPPALRVPSLPPSRPAVAPTTQPPAKAVAAMAVNELKSFLRARGVDFSGCCEKRGAMKSELLALAEENLGSQLRPKSGNKCGQCGQPKKGHVCSGFISRPATVLGTRLRQVNVCPIQELRSQLLSSVSGQPLDLVPASEEEEEEESELLALVATDRYGRPPIVLETRLRPIRSQLLPSVSDLVPASEENAPRSGNEASQPAVGKYKCGQCGQPKKGHVCPVQQERPEKRAKAEPKPKRLTADGREDGRSAANLYVMLRNKSIDPPSRGVKAHPQGAAGALAGKCFVVSGVLDSMTRDECAAYIQRHGGQVGKSLTLKTTHILNDHGEVGWSKRKQATARGIPIVSEDVMFQLVRAFHA